MDAQEQQAFVAKVVADAEEIEFLDILGSAKPAQASKGKGQRDEQFAAAQEEAKRLVREPTVTERLCPALRGASDDLGSIAKTVGTALLPLALTPAAVVPLSSLVMGAVAVLVTRAGIAAICPKPEGK